MNQYQNTDWLIKQNQTDIYLLLHDNTYIARTLVNKIIRFQLKFELKNLRGPLWGTFALSNGPSS